LIKVLHVYKSYFPVIGGITSHLKVLCLELAKDKNIDVQILVTNQNRNTVKEMDQHVRVIKVGKIFEFASTPISLSMPYWMKRLNPDLIHLHFPYPIGELSALFVNSNRKIVLTYHSEIVKQRALLICYQPFLRRILDRVDVIIASSPNYVATSNCLIGLKHKIKVIPYGIDLSRFEKKDENRIKSIKAQYKSPLVLFVGMFRYYKGLEVLIEAAKRVEGSFLLIGKGKYRSKLESQVKKGNLIDKIFFLEEVEDDQLPAFYHASDIFVLPSTHRSEAFGIVQLEAMACGLPVISTELGTGTTFVNIHQQTGLVVPPRDPQALANALNILLANKNLREQLSLTGKQRVSKEFSKELMTERIKKVYYELLNK